MTPVPPSLDRFGDELHRAACRELPTDSEPARTRAGLLRRPRVLAGGSLGLAGVAAALVVALTAGGAAAPPAFAVTTASNGTVLVHLSNYEGVAGADHQLASMGINDWIQIGIVKGAQAAAPVTCSSVSGRPVQVVMDSGVVPGAGSWHLGECSLHPGTVPGVNENTGTGNTGPGNTGPGNTGPGTTGTGNTGS